MNVCRSCNDVSDIVPLYIPQRLFLKPIARLNISVQLPQLRAPDKSISSWEVMEKLRKMVKPEKFSVLRVTKSTLEFLRFEAETEAKAKISELLVKLDNRSIKLSGFVDPLKVRAAEAKIAFPNRHAWDSFFREAKHMNEMRPGERPDTMHITNLPCKWFTLPEYQDKEPKPSEYIFRKVFEVYGEVRYVDIPCTDPYRSRMKSKGSGDIRTFSFDEGHSFEAFVQYKEYMGFLKAMTALRGMQLLYKDGDKAFTAAIKVDYDRTKHMTDHAIRRRHVERERLIQQDALILDKERRVREASVARQNEELKKAEAEQKRLQELANKKKDEKKKVILLQVEDAEKRRRHVKRRLAKEQQKLQEAQQKLQNIHLLDMLLEKVKVKEILKKKLKKEKKKKKEKSSAPVVPVVKASPIGDDDDDRELLQARELQLRERLLFKYKEALDKQLSEELGGLGAIEDAAGSSNSNGPTSADAQVFKKPAPKFLKKDVPTKQPTKRVVKKPKVVVTAEPEPTTEEETSELAENAISTASDYTKIEPKAETMENKSNDIEKAAPVNVGCDDKTSSLPIEQPEEVSEAKLEFNGIASPDKAEIDAVKNEINDAPPETAETDIAIEVDINGAADEKAASEHKEDESEPEEGVIDSESEAEEGDGEEKEDKSDVQEGSEGEESGSESEVEKQSDEGEEEEDEEECGSEEEAGSEKGDNVEGEEKTEESASEGSEEEGELSEVESQASDAKSDNSLKGSQKKRCSTSPELNLSVSEDSMRDETHSKSSKSDSASSQSSSSDEEKEAPKAKEKKAKKEKEKKRKHKKKSKKRKSSDKDKKSKKKKKSKKSTKSDDEKSSPPRVASQVVWGRGRGGGPGYSGGQWRGRYQRQPYQNRGGRGGHYPQPPWFDGAPDFYDFGGFYPPWPFPVGGPGNFFPRGFRRPNMRRPYFRHQDQRPSGFFGDNAEEAYERYFRKLTKNEHDDRYSNDDYSGRSRSRSRSRSGSRGYHRSRSRRSRSRSRSYSRSRSRDRRRSRSRSRGRRSWSRSRSRSRGRRSRSSSLSTSRSRSRSSRSRSRSRSRCRGRHSRGRSRSQTRSRSRNRRSKSSSRSKGKSRSRSRSPRRTRSRSPKRSRSRSPKRSKSGSPKRPKSRSPKRSKSRSPKRSKSRSPKHSKSHSPKRSKSRSPKHSKSQSPKRSKSRSTSRQRTLSGESRRK